MVALFAGLAGCAGGSAPVRSPPCGPRAAVTVGEQARARVYVVGHYLGGCQAGHLPVALLSYGLSYIRPLPVAINGGLVAFGAVESSDGGDSYDTVVRVHDLAAAGDADIVDAGATDGHEKIVRIVLSSAGDVAWTACPIARRRQAARPGFCARPGSVVHVYQVRHILTRRGRKVTFRLPC